jgi:protein-S-isoprenylcysteine O-methyltransferase Ste14
MRKIMPTTYLLISILMMVALHFRIPLVQVIPVPWNMVGALPIVAGVALNLIADNAFRKGSTTVKPFEESNILVTNGVFCLSRNPMYLGFILILLGIAVILGSLTPFAIVPVFAVLMDQVFIQVEESMLQVKFDQDWLEYKATVRRWI